MKKTLICKTAYPEIHVAGIGAFKDGQKVVVDDPIVYQKLISTGSFFHTEAEAARAEAKAEKEVADAESKIEGTSGKKVKGG